jgi:hypothetical protein
MERQDILAALAELKLHGMRASFDEIAGKGLSRRDEFYPLIAGLIRAERTHRQARSDQLSDHRRQIPGAQGSRQVQLQGHADR